MGLYDRWVADSETGQKIRVHSFSAALRELARGAVTKAQVVAAFSLTAEDEAELDLIIGAYQSLGTVEERVSFLMKFHDVTLLCEAGLYDETKARDELGF